MVLDFSRLPALYAGRHRTQASFATAIGVTQSYVSQLMRNEKRGSLGLVERIATELGMAPAAVLIALQKNITESSCEGLTA